MMHMKIWDQVVLHQKMAKYETSPPPDPKNDDDNIWWYNVGENLYKKKKFEIKLSSIKDGQARSQSSPWPQNWQYLDCYLTSFKVVCTPRLTVY